MTEIANEESEELGGKPVQNLADVEHKSSFLIYGEAGIGKTFLACTADSVPSLRRVLLLDFEGGALSVAANFPNVKHRLVEEYEELQDIFDDLYLNNKVAQYSTIILDNLTEICHAGLSRAAREAFERHEKDSYGEDHVTQRAYGTNLIRIRNLVRAYRSLPVTTIWTAWETLKTKNSGKQVIGPSFPGQLQAHIPGMVQNVGRLARVVNEDNGESVRYIRFEETDNVQAKRRSRLDETIDWPTMPKLWEQASKAEPVEIQE